MQTFIIIIKIVLSLLPSIIEAVKTIEAAFPATGQGEAKLQIIRSILETAYEKGADATVTFERIWPAIQSAVAAVVSMANSIGLFKK